MADVDSSIKVGGSYKDILGVFVKIAGVYIEATKAFKKESNNYIQYFGEISTPAPTGIQLAYTAQVDTGSRVCPLYPSAATEYFTAYGTLTDDNDNYIYTDSAKTTFAAEGTYTDGDLVVYFVPLEPNIYLLGSCS